MELIVLKVLEDIGIQIKKKIVFLDLNNHIKRLYNSSKSISFNFGLSQKDLKNQIINIIKKEKIYENIYIRITMFIGKDTTWSDTNHIDYLISIRSIKSELYLSKSISLSISNFKRISSYSMPPSIKAGANYLNSRYALLDRKKLGYDGALFITHDNFISESTGSCIFFIKGKKLFTPSKECDILEGITRNRIINLCLKNKIIVEQVKIKKNNIKNFDAAFLAGTMIEIKPISNIDNIRYDSSNKLIIEIINFLKSYIYES